MSVVYFTDRDLGKQFPETLRTAGLTVERHDDHFAHNTQDEHWLADVGRRGWIAITHDARIRYKPNELAAVVTHNVGLLVVVGRAPFSELAASFVATHSRIEAFLARQRPPFIAKVYRASTKSRSASGIAPGRVELWYP